MVALGVTKRNTSWTNRVLWALAITLAMVITGFLSSLFLSHVAEVDKNVSMYFAGQVIWMTAYIGAVLGAVLAIPVNLVVLCLAHKAQQNTSRLRLVAILVGCTLSAAASTCLVSTVDWQHKPASRR